MIINILISYRANLHIIEKLNKPSFGYYEFISAADSLRETASSDSYHTMERKKLYFFKGRLFIKKWI